MSQSSHMEHNCTKQRLVGSQVQTLRNQDTFLSIQVSETQNICELESYHTFHSNIHVSETRNNCKLERSYPMKGCGGTKLENQLGPGCGEALGLGAGNLRDKESAQLKSELICIDL